ncbi:MAG: hypothetical protein AAGA58_14745, partial [Verrucomicrobiota bacterium]
MESDEEEARDVYYRRFDEDYVPGQEGEDAGRDDEEPVVRVSETDDFDEADEDEALLDEGVAAEDEGKRGDEMGERDGAGERVLYRGHPAWLSFWRGLLVSVVLLMAGVLGWGVSGWILFGGLVVALMVYGNVVFLRSMREYLVTER